MTQEETWMTKYDEVVKFIEKNKRNTSRYDAEERGKYCNWIKHNRKMYNAGKMRIERVEKFEELKKLMEENKGVNQYS